jgi:hypothetical protein
MEFERTRSIPDATASVVNEKLLKLPTEELHQQESIAEIVANPFPESTHSRRPQSSHPPGQALHAESERDD